MLHVNNRSIRWGSRIPQPEYAQVVAVICGNSMALIYKAEFLGKLKEVFEIICRLVFLRPFVNPLGELFRVLLVIIGEFT